MEDATEQPSVSLPDDLTEEIFARMPAKSVQRCRCLSRAWAATLSSQGFVDRHLRLANRRGSPRLYILPEYGSRDTTVHAWSPGRPLARLRRVVAVTGQCRGLVVLEADRPMSSIDFTYEVNNYVWNPSTGQITALPKGKQNLGIGYDTRIRKHKCRGELPPACEVYVLNSMGQWRPPGFATNFCTDQSIFAQGHMYWVAEPDNKFNFERIIMSFSILPPPPVKMYPCQIRELDGRLCVFNNTDELKRSYDIWLLRDHQGGLWDLRCSIDLDTPPLADTQLKHSRSVIPLGSVDDARRLLLRPDLGWIKSESLDSHQLFMYRPATGDVEDLLAGGGILTHHTMARRVMAPYDESLESTRNHDSKSQS
ncbi:hypothetical protein CFC21_081504 [Triticum aestivum]|uniref:F-box domain-containing protein n=2 Tax=Triticum aestivum TaxID=4565 RepID=A0A3B6NJ19_WHEAT|nr:hypothetical protein CFC21_081504 [Triticum aestivum]